MFLSQTIDTAMFKDNILNLKGFNSVDNVINITTLLIDENDANKAVLQQAMEKLNGMYLRDDQNRLVSVKMGLLGH